MIPGVRGRDIREMLAPQGPPRQPIPGFDPDYADIVDYILRCTHRIWEGKDLGLIETHYAPDMTVHTMAGPVIGATGVVAATARTLAVFPDRELIGEAVVWSEERPGVYLSSHRITSVATHLGPGDFGPPTGRRIAFTTVADCLVEANRIVEEWLARDYSGIALQLGLSPRALAAAAAAADPPGPAPWRAEAIARARAAPATPFPAAIPSPAGDAHEFACAWFDAVWNHRRFHLVRSAMSPAVHWSGPGGRRLFGWSEVTGWLTAMVASFGDLRVVVDHVAGVEDGDGRELAVRWSLAGTHDGPALYGPPTGRETHILGVTHWRVEHGAIVAEWTVFDEIALLRQTLGGL